MVLPRTAAALQVTAADVEVSTPDGTADCYFVHPTSGAHPGVLIWPDALGLRPAFEQMGRRLAESGYAVLVVNPYYRSAKAPVVEEGASFRDEATRNVIMPLMRSLSAETNVTDAKAFVGFLDDQDAVASERKMGTMGYCMGGSITMRTAAALPARIGAGASFHGGRARDGCAEQPPSIRRQDAGALPVRHRRERRQEAAGGQDRVAGGLCCRGTAGGDRSLRRYPARLVPSGFRRVPRSAGGAGLEPAADPVRDRVGLRRSQGHDGHGASARRLFGSWRSGSGEEVDERPCMEIYCNSPLDTAPADLLTDLCVPLRVPREG